MWTTPHRLRVTTLLNTLSLVLFFYPFVWIVLTLSHCVGWKWNLEQKYRSNHGSGVRLGRGRAGERSNSLSSLSRIWLLGVLLLPPPPSPPLSSVPVLPSPPLTRGPDLRFRGTSSCQPQQASIHCCDWVDGSEAQDRPTETTECSPTPTPFPSAARGFPVPPWRYGDDWDVRHVRRATCNNIANILSIWSHSAVFG